VTVAFCLLGIVGGAVLYGGNFAYAKWLSSRGPKPLATLSAGNGAGDAVDAVGFSPDSLLLAAAYEDGTVRLWDVATHQLADTLPAGSSAVNGVAFSPDRQLLAAGGADDDLVLWDVGSRKKEASLPAGGVAVNGVAFSPDSDLVAAAEENGDVRLWDTRTKEPGQNPLSVAGSKTGAAYGVAFDGNGELVAAYADGDVRLWDLQHNVVKTTFSTGPKPVYAVAVSPDGTRVATADGDGTVGLWNLATGKPAGRPLSAATPRVYGVAFSHDGKTVAAADDNGTARLWNVATGQPAGPSMRASTGYTFKVAFSVDGGLLATADGDGTVRLWTTVVPPAS
jgi:WD40 repeat protein